MLLKIPDIPLNIPCVLLNISDILLKTRCVLLRIPYNPSKTPKPHVSC